MILIVMINTDKIIKTNYVYLMDLDNLIEMKMN